MCRSLFKFRPSQATKTNISIKLPGFLGVPKKPDQPGTVPEPSSTLGFRFFRATDDAGLASINIHCRRCHKAKPKRKQGPTAKPLDPNRLGLNLTQLLFQLLDDRVQHRRSFECCLSANLWVEVRGPKWTIRWGPPTKLSWAPVGDNQGPKNKATTMDPDH